jgi:hypothetical protein
MKVELYDLRLGISSIGGKAMVGILSNPLAWKVKHEIHNDFLHAVVECWKNQSQVVTAPDGKQYEISVKEIK